MRLGGEQQLDLRDGLIGRTDGKVELGGHRRGWMREAIYAEDEDERQSRLVWTQTDGQLLRRYIFTYIHACQHCSS